MSTRILLVDDDTALSEMVGMTLESGGYDVVYCADGTHALQAFTINQPELVLLDLMLPGMDGIEICRRIRAISDVPIIMLTARSDTQDVVAGLEAGADDYVAKPFKNRELMARVRTACAVSATSPPMLSRPRTSCALATSILTCSPTRLAAQAK